MERHGSESYFVLGEGLLGESAQGRARTLSAAAEAQTPPFRFSRMGPHGIGVGQFIDHDLTFDKTQVMLGQNVSPAQLLQARSPSLDLDSLYGAGPQDPDSAKFYSDGLHLKMGDTVAAGDPEMTGFDLPRVGTGSTNAAKREALIPDRRNDENLVVAQTHLAFIRFHNRVVDSLPAALPPAQKFAQARELVVKHYQWMIRTDFLPRICKARPGGPTSSCPRPSSTGPCASTPSS